VLTGSEDNTARLWDISVTPPGPGTTTLYAHPAPALGRVVVFRYVSRVAGIRVGFRPARVFSFRASDTSILPNFALHRVGTPLIKVRILAPQPYDILMLSVFVCVEIRPTWPSVTLHHNGPDPETQNRGRRRAKVRDVSRARFRPITCRALCWVSAASGRRKSEEPPLLLPIFPGQTHLPAGFVR
jgi:hypothetical protein